MVEKMQPEIKSKIILFGIPVIPSLAIWWRSLHSPSGTLLLVILLFYHLQPH